MITNPNIEAKLQKLKDYWYDDNDSLKYVSNIETRIRKLIVAEDLSHNKAILEIVAEAKERVSAIDKFLIYKEEMTELERKKLLVEKMVHRFYLSRFDGSGLDEKFNNIEKMLDDQIERLKD
jgi:hypothetical protein